MANEKFCLRWNDFASNIGVAFRELREDQEFFDVTLACDEDQIQAHKVILSACSPFFRRILQRNPHPHPVLYLKGVKLGNLKSILNFMYHGEVNLAQEDLTLFLEVAEELKVKGLTQKQSSKMPESRVAIQPREEDAPPGPDLNSNSRKLPPTSVLKPKQHPIPHIKDEFLKFGSEAALDQAHPSTLQSWTRDDAEEQHDDIEEHQDNTEKQHEVEDLGQYEGEGYGAEHGGDGNGGFDSELVNSFEDLLQFVVRTKGGHKCLCGSFSHSSIVAVQRHIESKHFPNHFVWNCDVCGKQPKTREALRLHTCRSHGKS